MGFAYKWAMENIEDAKRRLDGGRPDWAELFLGFACSKTAVGKHANARKSFRNMLTRDEKKAVNKAIFDLLKSPLWGDYWDNQPRGRHEK